MGKGEHPIGPDEDRLYALLNEAVTFYSQFSEDERISEDKAISHILTIARQPDVQAIHRVAKRIADDWRADEFGIRGGYLAYQLLLDLLRCVFAPRPGADGWLPQPTMLDRFNGKLRLHRHVGHLLIAGHLPTFDEWWALWSDNPRRDLTPYLQEIMTPEELAADRRTGGEIRGLDPPAQSNPATVFRCLSALRTAVAEYPGPSMVDALLAVAQEPDTAAISLAGTRLLFSDADPKKANAVLCLLLPILFGPSRFGNHGDHSLAPWAIQNGRLTLADPIDNLPSVDHWEGEVYYRGKLYHRREF